jgi:hypothetical protein
MSDNQTLRCESLRFFDVIANKHLHTSPFSFWWFIVHQYALALFLGIFVRDAICQDIAHLFLKIHLAEK